MILSITKKIRFKINFILAVTLLFEVTACSHQKNEKPLDANKKNFATPLNLAATNPTKSNFFIDKTKEYGLENIKAVHTYAVDLNNDGYADLVILDDFLAVPKFYYFNKIKNKFELGETPFDEVVRASFLNFVDLNHDGVYDLIIGNLNQKTEMTKYPPRIYKGELKEGKLHFTKVGVLPIGILPTSNISVLDFDLDGKLDLFISNWFEFKDGKTNILPNVLLKGDGFNFENVSYLLKGEYDQNKSSKEFKNIAPTFGSTVCDIDQNGFPDILTNSSNGYFNKMWMNLEKGEEREFNDFAEVSGYAADDEGTKENKGGGNSFFSLCGDYNNDKIIDIVIGNLFHDTDPESRDRSAILTGSTFKFPPKFLRSEFYQSSGAKSWSEGDRRGVFIDYNLDGNEDIIIENSGFPPDSRLVFFKQESDHAFTDIAKEIGIDIMNPSGAVTLDVNKDGIMDFIVGQTDVRSGNSATRLYLYVNQTKREGKGSIRFHLQGKQSNTHGISGSVYLQTNLHRYFRNVQYNYGSLPSQNEEGLYFAFDREIPESVIVSWPYGARDRLNRLVPELKKYDLKKLKLKSSHHEFNLCEDGRILAINKNCY